MNVLGRAATLAVAAAFSLSTLAAYGSGSTGMLPISPATGTFDAAGAGDTHLVGRPACTCRVVPRRELTQDPTVVVATGRPSMRGAAGEVVIAEAAARGGAVAGCVTDCECRGPFQVHDGRRQANTSIPGRRVLLLHPSDLLLAPGSRTVYYADGSRKVHGEVYGRGHVPGSRPDLGCQG